MSAAMVVKNSSAPDYCSFCGKSRGEVGKLIAGPEVFICDECVELCMDMCGFRRVIPEMLETMKVAAEQFRHYEMLHRAKPDHAKADTNAQFAERCEAAIAKAEGR